MSKETSEPKPSRAEIIYTRITRISEAYIFLCFILIAVIPLLEYSWVPGFVKFIYFTGFPLLIILLLASLVRESIIKLLSLKFGSPPSEVQSTRRK